MVENIQADLNFKQLSLLRKVLQQKSTGMFLFDLASGGKGTVKINKGNIIDDDGAVEHLSDSLSEAVLRCGWVPLKVTHNHRELDPQGTMIRVLNHIHWSDADCVRLKLLFMKLPCIQVSMVLRDMKGFKEGLTYLILYKRSINESDFTPACFLKGIDDHDMLERRLKVLVLAYCLGLIKAKPQVAINPNNKSVSSIVSRIFQRVRGI
ncbi:MAG: hypothetical protein Q9M20_00670 [Mariprofundaceae bacterium]|nr:hypothetical protein [Mariprofundaceae bacterium]